MEEHPLIDVKTKIPSVMIDLRYASENNFMGKRINGYKKARCFLSLPAAEALAKVQATLEAQGQTIKIWDCYRPQRAVDEFVAWVNSPDDLAAKAIYYPKVEKASLIQEGYIASHSGHSRGSTVDMTIVDKATGKEWDMGTSFDFFDPKSHTFSSLVTQAQHENRMKLKALMEQQGFVSISAEWWHFTLNDEPYPDTYFDFIIE